MSQLIKPLSVKDTVLDISDSVNFAIYKGAQNVTSQRYQANSSSSNQMVFAIQVPSTSTIVSRNVTWGSVITFQLNGVVGENEYLWNGEAINQVNSDVSVVGADCFAPFLLHQLCNNMSCQINNTSVTQNQVNTILDPILRGLDKKEFQKWYGSTPTQLDYWGNNESALPQVNVSEAALGSPVIQSPFLATWNSPFNTGYNQNCKDLESRASFVINSVTGNTPGSVGNLQKNVTITVTVREPIFLSPFIFNGDFDQTGITGITQLNFTMAMDSTAKRALRWVQSTTALSTKFVQGVTYIEPFMDFIYYTAPATMLIPATCVTPLMNLVNYISPNVTPLAASASASYISQALQLNSIPDKIIVWIDDSQKQGANGNQVSDHYGTINKVNITFNNQTGILSNFSQKQLFDASLKSGSQQTFEEFSGLVNAGSYGNIQSNAPTCGSVLYLNFGQIVQISEVYNAPGSLSTTQFQIQVETTNNTGGAITPQLNCMFVYSGILSTTNGNSASYLNGILTRNDVLNSANSPEQITKRELSRYMGAGIFSDLKAMASNYLPIAKKMLEGVDNKYAKLGANTLDTLGFGAMSAGAMSAGAMSGGRMRSKLF